MPYRIAGIDVHKKMLAVVVSDVEIESEYQFERRMFSSNPEQLRSLAAWLVEQEAEEVVMESTAQYWKPVWGALERYGKPMCEKREGASLTTSAISNDVGHCKSFFFHLSVNSNTRLRPRTNCVSFFRFCSSVAP